jgi:uncharacterized protein
MNLSVTSKERIVSLDVIRGIAIMGIFFVNIPTMIGIEDQIIPRAYEGTEAIIRLLYDLFIQTKFYSIFAFLFGLGFYIFMSRAEAKGKPMNQLFVRRLLLLLVIGISHGILLWTGDILNMYAVQGFWLLLFYRRNPKTIFIWSIVLVALFTAFSFFAFPISMTATTSIVPSGLEYNPYDDYGADLISRSIFMLIYGISNWIGYLPEVLGLFLLGLYCGKINLFNRVGELAKKIRMAQIISFVLAVLFSIPILMYYNIYELYDSRKIYFFIFLSGKSLAVFYVTTLILLFQKPKLQALLRPFSYVGRMALTNYLFQTIITVLVVPLFISNVAAYPLWVTTIYCIVLYAIQVGISKWWLARFEFGPMEWLWRMGTYWQVQPIKRRKPLADESSLRM